MFGKTNKTNADLLQRLSEAENVRMTNEQMEIQKRNYVRGEMAIGSDKDEADMIAAITSGDQEKIAFLEEKGAARAARVDAWYGKGETA